MGFCFSIPLPGPFRYSARVGRHRRQRKPPRTQLAFRLTAGDLSQVTESLPRGFWDWPPQNQEAWVRAHTPPGSPRLGRLYRKQIR